MLSKRFESAPRSKIQDPRCRAKFPGHLGSWILDPRALSKRFESTPPTKFAQIPRTSGKGAAFDFCKPHAHTHAHNRQEQGAKNREPQQTKNQTNTHAHRDTPQPSQNQGPKAKHTRRAILSVTLRVLSTRAPMDSVLGVIIMVWVGSRVPKSRTSVFSVFGIVIMVRGIWVVVKLWYPCGSGKY